MELIGKSGEFNDAHFPINGSVTLGRDPGKCQICFSGNAKGVSGVHCKIEQINNEMYVTDLNSTNGTFMEDGTRIPPNVPRKLENNQRFYLGNVGYMFEVQGITSVVTFKPEPQRNNNKAETSEPQVIKVENHIKKGGGAGAVIAVILLILVVVGGGVMFMSSPGDAPAPIKQLIGMCKEPGCDRTNIYKDGYCEIHYFTNVGESVIDTLIN